MRISDWSSDVCSSDLNGRPPRNCPLAGNCRRSQIASPPISHIPADNNGQPDRLLPLRQNINKPVWGRCRGRSQGKTGELGEQGGAGEDGHGVAPSGGGERKSAV